IQPLCAQLSDILGRKSVMLSSIMFFFIGGAICGTANSGGVLITGRVIQGIGSGGVMLLMEVILCDIVSLRERSKYLSIVLSMAAIGAMVGPPLGGAIAEGSWRWIFFINLPLSAIALLAMAVFMKLSWKKPSSWKTAALQVDWIDTTTFTGSITSILYGLVVGSSNLPWTSPGVILPLILGFIGWICFHAYEASKYPSNPAVPSHLFGNRTSAAAFRITFVISIFNVSFDRNSYLISDPNIRDLMSHGNAYQYISGPLIKSLPESVKSEVIAAYARSLRTVWEVAIGIASLGMFLVCLERHVPLRKDLNTSYGINEESIKHPEDRQGVELDSVRREG
ncbi:major facilitator superfamily domain-containing protein, partial [Lophiotrema nucula]